MENDERVSTDEELARRAQSGEHESYAVLVERYEEKMKRYALRILSNSDEVDDVVQDVFFKAYRNLRSFDSQRRFSPWLYRIAHNELMNSLKRRYRDPLLFFDPETLFPHPASDEDIAGDAERKEITHLIEGSLQKLPAKYREPLFFFYVEGLTYQEIADVLHIPRGTVSIRIRRGKGLLKSLVEQTGYRHESE
ncbi:MAG: sigma-70 family RNA polymerase sigma factor [bacterium]